MFYHNKTSIKLTFTKLKLILLLVKRMSW